MHPAKIVKRKPQGIRGLQVFPLLAESVRQPRHPAHSRADRKVLPLDVRRANPGRIGLPQHRLCYDLYNSSQGIG